MHQRRLARLRGIRRAGQVLRGQALEEDRARSLIVDAVGHRDGALGRHDDLRGVPGTGDHRPRDVVTFTHLTTGDAGADGAHDPRALGADDERGRERVGAGAVVDVDEVDPRRGHVDAQLTRAGVGAGQVLGYQHLGAAGFVDEYRTHARLLLERGGGDAARRALFA